jgi:hypothetical protein
MSYVIVIQDHESYSPEAWGPFPTEELAEDYCQHNLDPAPLPEDVQIVPLNSLED